MDALNLSNGTHQGDGITQEKQYILKADTKFQLESSYFKVNTNSLDVLEATTNLSDVKVIQSDRKITLPTIPLQVQPIDKLPLAGDVDTTSDKDLKYKMFIPLSGKANMAKFMSDTATDIKSSTNLITKIFQNYTTPVNQTPLQPYSTKTPAEITAIVKADVMSKYAQLGINENNITFDPATTSFPKQQLLADVTFNIRFSEYFDFRNGRSNVRVRISSNSSTYTAEIILTTENQNDKPTIDITDEVIKTIMTKSELVVKTGFSASITYIRRTNFIDGIQVKFNETASHTATYDGSVGPINAGTLDDLNIKNQSFIFVKRIEGEQIQVPILSIANFPDITYNIERETVYNKAKFYNAIAQTFGVQTVDIPLKEVQNLPIQRIHSLTLSGFWGDEVGVSLNQNINMVANNSSEFDETISQFTMIFC